METRPWSLGRTFVAFPCGRSRVVLSWRRGSSRLFHSIIRCQVRWKHCFNHQLVRVKTSTILLKFLHTLASKFAVLKIKKPWPFVCRCVHKLLHMAWHTSCCAKMYRTGCIHVARCEQEHCARNKSCHDFCQLIKLFGIPLCSEEKSRVGEGAVQRTLEIVHVEALRRGTSSCTSFLLPCLLQW